MQKEGVFDLFLGIFILFLSIVVWRFTENFWGWIILFLPGAFYVVRGLYKLIHNDLIDGG
jgi:hypothetical protein